MRADTAAADGGGGDATADDQTGGLRADQLAKLGAESDDDMAGGDVAGGAGLVVDRADHDHVGGVSQTGAIAGNLAAASALRARLTGELISRCCAWNLLQQSAALALRACLKGAQNSRCGS